MPWRESLNSSRGADRKPNVEICPVCPPCRATFVLHFLPSSDWQGFPYRLTAQKYESRMCDSEAVIRLYLLKIRQKTASELRKGCLRFTSASGAEQPGGCRGRQNTLKNHLCCNDRHKRSTLTWWAACSLMRTLLSESQKHTLPSVEELTQMWLCPACWQNEKPDTRSLWPTSSPEKLTECGCQLLFITPKIGRVHPIWDDVRSESGRQRLEVVPTYRPFFFTHF